MSNQIDNLGQRLVYEKAVQVLLNAGVSTDISKLTRSTLRFEQQLNTAASFYTFGVTTQDNGPAGTKFNTEVRLDLQNSFVVSSISMYIAEPSAATDATFIDCTYPSPAIFTNTGEAAALGVLYHSQLKLTVNNVVVTPSLYTSRFRRVQEAQKVAAGTNQNGIANDSIDMAVDGLDITEPNLYFIGSKGNLLQLFLPAAVSAIGADGFTRVIIECRGLLAQNSTIIT